MAIGAQIEAMASLGLLICQESGADQGRACVKRAADGAEHGRVTRPLIACGEESAFQASLLSHRVVSNGTTPTEKEMNMMNSSDWEEGGPESDCRGVEMTQHCHRKGLLAIASVALLAGTLMLSNHEALARGDGGFGGGHEGSFGGVGFHGSAFGGGFGGGHNRIGGFGARGFSRLAG